MTAADRNIKTAEFLAQMIAYYLTLKLFCHPLLTTPCQVAHDPLRRTPETRNEPHHRRGAQPDSGPS